jgi:Type ISP C-terminal specificity domain
MTSSFWELESLFARFVNLDLWISLLWVCDLACFSFSRHPVADAFWSNVPARVWDYTLGGYQVIKKWLSCREHPVLGRALKPEEAIYVSEMVRGIAAILLMGPALDANYADCKAAAVAWKDGAPAA